jgi:hypothetical protein
MKTTDIEREVILFRTDPHGPNRHHVDTWNLIAEIGGGIAINYGLFKAIPSQHRAKRAKAAERLADLLEGYASAH